MKGNNECKHIPKLCGFDRNDMLSCRSGKGSYKAFFKRLSRQSVRREAKNKIKNYSIDDYKGESANETQS